MRKTTRIPLHKRPYLSRAVAAAYLGVKTDSFDRVVATGQMPPPGDHRQAPHLEPCGH